ncbi:MAG: wax ester/triacylglycerol synthase family O-acyltransferase, partial [Burkholderiales bacterium]|nr:wax ester/triacylglycerol synthase family O-acyltransferase [Burkholderiales bacterium]
MNPHAERMSRVDTAWLRMDSDVNLMLIVGVWLIAPALGLDELRARVAERLLAYRRFRQKAVVDATGANWVLDADFDLARHVVAERLPRRRGRSERTALQALCGELAMKPLDRAHPLWQFHLVEDYEGGSALVMRIHHSIADGIALIAVTLSITDGGRAPPARAPAAEPEADWLADAVLKPLTEMTVKAIGLYGGGVTKALALLADPPDTLGLARSGTRIV